MEPLETNYISRDKSETFNTKDYKNAFDIHYLEGKDNQVYVWHISPLWTSSKQQRYSRQESKKYEDIGMVSGFCSNSARRNELRSSFGELCRVSTLGIAKWT